VFMYWVYVVSSHEYYKIIQVNLNLTYLMKRVRFINANSLISCLARIGFVICVKNCQSLSRVGFGSYQDMNIRLHKSIIYNSTHLNKLVISFKSNPLILC